MCYAIANLSSSNVMYSVSVKEEPNVEIGPL
jgi:hypothetical protein